MDDFRRIDERLAMLQALRNIYDRAQANNGTESERTVDSISRFSQATKEERETTGDVQVIWYPPSILAADTGS